MNRAPILDYRRFILILWVLMATGFLATSLIGYEVSRQAIRDTIIGQDLPLTSSNIYSEIQKDLVRPVLISMTMAHDTFLRDWVLKGERDAGEIARYLREIKQRHGAFSSFFISEKTAKYYTAEGILKRVTPFEPRDAWYYRVRGMSEDYEINVDPDLANADALTIFINYRVYDYDGNFIGATGIGLTVDAVLRTIEEYQSRFKRKIYFVDGLGKVVEFAARGKGDDLKAKPGIGPMIPQILAARQGSFQYEAGGDTHILHVNYLPELKWYLFVEQNESVALAGIRRTLYTNLLISFVVTLIVVLLTHFAFRGYQTRLEEMASTDKLTGLLNRQAFSILIEKLLAGNRRAPSPLSILMVDIDRFKAINDAFGHHAGDIVLAEVARRLAAGLRESDLAVRWGGEEFMLVLRGCDIAAAQRIAENLRNAVKAVPVQVGERPLAVTVSVGVSRFRNDEVQDLAIGRADQALYQAKAGGRDRVCVAGE
jgi:diguanylate cyclase (GGDEF)-like protein